MTVLFYNKIIGLPLITRKSKKICGEVNDLIVDPKSGKVLGIVALDYLNSKKQAFIPIETIASFKKDKVEIEKENVLKPIEKIENSIKILLGQKIKIKGNKVITQSGSNLGEVSDFEINTIQNKLEKIHVSGGIIKDLIQGELIIPATKIISINKEAITVQDGLTKEKELKKQFVTQKKLAGAEIFSVD